MNKKLFSGLLTLCMLLGLLTMNAFAAEPTVGITQGTAGGAPAVFANGNPVVIEEIEGTTYIYINGHVENKIRLSTASIVYGGSLANESAHNVTLASTSVTMKSGTVSMIYGGGFANGRMNGTDPKNPHTCTVDVANVTISGGTVTNFVHGGGHANQGGKSVVTSANVTITGGTFTNVFAGGRSVAGGAASVVETGKAVLDIENATINGGIMGAVTKGGTATASVDSVYMVKPVGELAKGYYKLAGGALTVDEAANKAAADKAAADTVIAKINDIGTVVYTDVCKGKIDVARTDYDALTEDQKALVTAEQLKVLTDAETAYAELKAAADKLAADKAAAKAVDDKIDLIGEVEYTDVCKGKIDAARTAYDALTDDQKAHVAKLDALTKAEADYAALDAAAHAGVKIPTIKVAKTVNGTVKTAPVGASEGAAITVFVTPDAGYQLSRIAAMAGETQLNIRESAENRYVFTMPDADVVVSAEFVKADAPVEPEKPEFTDVPAGTELYKAVEWAVENGITFGTTATTFEPQTAVTRAQIVTFLWREAGKPEPKTAECRFTDVDMNGDFGKAILWAVENGITVGTSETTFTPDKTVTRAEAATFLWRAAGKPAAVNAACSFTDVAEDAWYRTPVLWAVENGITFGTSETAFTPDEGCARGQIVTMMYREALLK